MKNPQIAAFVDDLETAKNTLSWMYDEYNTIRLTGLKEAQIEINKVIIALDNIHTLLFEEK